MGSMRKEVTIGFSAIAVLLLVLGVLIYRRAAAMWQTPDPSNLAAAPVTSIVPIDGRPRVVVAQDAPPADQQIDADGRDPGAESIGAEQLSATPVARHEPPHSSFLPRRVDPAENDPANSPAYGGDPTSGDQDPAGVDGSPAQAPADADSSMNGPVGARQTSLEVSDGDLAPPATGRQPFNADANGTGLPGDPASMTADLRNNPNGQDWSASDRDAAEGLPISGALPAEANTDAAYNQQGIPDPAAAAPTAGYSEVDRREDDRQFGQARQEPERVAVENGKYTVAPNDNYWIIAEKVYGNGAYFKALFEHNRARHPRSEKLQVGDVLDAPSVGLLADRYPDLCPRPRKVPNARQTLQPASTRRHAGERVYVVGEGDTLFDIARHELGKAARWTEIYDLNRDVLGEDFDYLRPGTELALPRDRRDADTVTRKDEPVYQR
jgi:nucleoid-associated protein YgaU